MTSLPSTSDFFAKGSFEGSENLAQNNYVALNKSLNLSVGHFSHMLNESDTVFTS